VDVRTKAYLVQEGSRLLKGVARAVVARSLRSSTTIAGAEPEVPQEAPPASSSPQPVAAGHPSALSDRRGTGCRPCTSDHFSTCAGALAEALRFARVDGIEDQQVQDRIALCVEELNIWERVDAAADKLPSLAAPEREFVHRWLPKGRDLRHQLNEIGTLEDLEAAAALARQLSREARTEMRQLRPPVMSKIESLAQKVKSGEISNKEALGQLTNWWGKQHPEEGG
jgi:hypothetical protein